MILHGIVVHYASRRAPSVDKPVLSVRSAQPPVEEGAATGRFRKILGMQSCGSARLPAAMLH